jgi:hypothetical protein
MKQDRVVWVLIIVAAALLSVTRTVAGDSLVVTGTGSPGTWTTQLELANPGSTDLRVTIYETAGFQECSFPVCPFATVVVPGNGTIALETSSLSFDSATQLQTIYVTPSDGITLPTMRAQAINRAQPSQKNILPVVRLSTLNLLAPSVLSFPAASRTSITHSNIGVGVIAPDGTNPPFSIRIDVLSSTGMLLASGTFENTLVPELGFGANIYLVDVLGYLGITELEDGQVRVTKISGDGALWGEMATITSECGVLMTEGINP